MVEQVRESPCLAHPLAIACALLLYCLSIPSDISRRAIPFIYASSLCRLPFLCPARWWLALRG